MVMAEPTSRKALKPSADSAVTPTVAPTDEMVLVRRARQGDLAAYDDLVKMYQERIYATIYHMTSNHEDETASQSPAA